MARKQSLGTTVLLVVIALIAFWVRRGDESSREQRGGGSGGPAGQVEQGADEGSIESLFAARRSDVWVEGAGKVRNVLADDNEGDRHQRFILVFPSGHTVLVAHNIDVAPRVPLEAGDEIGFRGEYEWTERGGVLHWTHRDERGRRQGGHLSLDGRIYR